MRKITTVQHSSYKSDALSSIYCFNEHCSFWLAGRVAFGFPDGLGFLQVKQLEVLKAFRFVPDLIYATWELVQFSPIGTHWVYFQVENDLVIKTEHGYARTVLKFIYFLDVPETVLITKHFPKLWQPTEVTVFLGLWNLLADVKKNRGRAEGLFFFFPLNLGMFPWRSLYLPYSFW